MGGRMGGAAMCLVHSASECPASVPVRGESAVLARWTPRAREETRAETAGEVGALDLTVSCSQSLAVERTAQREHSNSSRDLLREERSRASRSRFPSNTRSSLSLHSTRTGTGLDNQYIATTTINHRRTIRRRRRISPSRPRPCPFSDCLRRPIAETEYHGAAWNSIERASSSRRRRASQAEECESTSGRSAASWRYKRREA